MDITQDQKKILDYKKYQSLYCNDQKEILKNIKHAFIYECCKFIQNATGHLYMPYNATKIITETYADFVLFGMNIVFEGGENQKKFDQFVEKQKLRSKIYDWVVGQSLYGVSMMRVILEKNKFDKSEELFLYNVPVSSLTFNTLNMGEDYDSIEEYRLKFNKKIMKFQRTGKEKREISDVQSVNGVDTEKIIGTNAYNPLYIINNDYGSLCVDDLNYGIGKSDVDSREHIALMINDVLSLLWKDYLMNFKTLLSVPVDNVEALTVEDKQGNKKVKMDNDIDLLFHSQSNVAQYIQRNMDHIATSRDTITKLLILLSSVSGVPTYRFGQNLGGGMDRVGVANLKTDGFLKRIETKRMKIIGELQRLVDNIASELKITEKATIKFGAMNDLDDTTILAMQEAGLLHSHTATQMLTNFDNDEINKEYSKIDESLSTKAIFNGIQSTTARQIQTSTGNDNGGDGANQ